MEGLLRKMRTISKQIKELDTTLEMVSEAEFSGQSFIDWSAFNSGGVECETGEFLYGLVRLVKPKYILETGTHHGIGASYMGLACKANGFGEVHTIEFLPENHAIARNRFRKLDIDRYVVGSLMDVAEYEPELKYQLILLDTEPQTRFAELLKFYESLDEGGYIFIHDLHRHMHQIEVADHEFAWPYGEIPDEMRKLVLDDKLRPFHFATPRGLTGFYKTSKDDYKWNSKRKK